MTFPIDELRAIDCSGLPGAVLAPPSCEGVPCEPQGVSVEARAATVGASADPANVRIVDAEGRIRSTGRGLRTE